MIRCRRRAWTGAGNAGGTDPSQGFSRALTCTNAVPPVRLELTLCGI